MQRTAATTPQRPATAEVERVQTRLGRWWDRHPRLLRTLTVIALTWGAGYLAWRVGWSWRGANPVAWTVLLVVEAFGTWSLANLAWFSWHLEPSVRPPATGGHRVDVYVCTYDEPVPVLRATLTGCQRMTYPHTTYLLDDGRRPEVAALAAELGARYLTRPDNSHAKAGNINAALPRTTGELVFVLDADHVPMPDALDALVGYFDDPDIAVVQTPHDFFNHDSAQHYDPGRHEQSVFYEVVLPGKSRHGAAFWCGSAALIRRYALLDVGGVATETIAEDFHTTIKMQRAGWKSHYHNEILVQGLAPHSLAAYLLQRDRWARGNLAVFTTPESPLRARGLTVRQRLSYFSSLSAYLAGPMRALLLGVLAATLWTGALPLRATWVQLALLWAPATALNLLAGSALSRGYMRARETFHFELTCAEIHLRALRCVVWPGRTTFRVTPKEGVDPGGFTALRQLPLPVLLAAALGIGLLARAASAVGWIPLPPLPGIALWAVPLLAAIELRRVLRTIMLHVRRHQTRAVFRFGCRVPVRVISADGNAAIGRLADLNPTGASLAVPRELPVGSRVRVRFSLPDATGRSRLVAADAEVRSCRRADDTFRVGVRFPELSRDAEQAVVEYCYVVSTFERLRGGQPRVTSRDDEPVSRRRVAA